MGKRVRNKKLKTLVDVILPVYGRFDLLTQCLDSIPEAMGTIPYSVTIVDNNSPDKVKFYADEIQKYYDPLLFSCKIDIVQNKTNLGFIGACNKGARRGTSPLIFFLNSDVILEPDSINKLVKTLDTPNIGVVGMKLLFPTSTQLHESGLDMRIRPAQKVQHIGLMTNVRGEVIHSFIGWSADSKKVNLVDLDEDGNELPYQARSVMAVTGAALMVRRNVFKLAGGFDKDFGTGTYEDVSLCMASRKLGYNVVVNPHAVGTHFVGASSEKYNAGFPLNQNYQIFVNKWHDHMKQWDYNIL